MYKVGDKFIIEIGEEYESEFLKTNIEADKEQKESPVNLYRIRGFDSLVFDKNGLKKLEKYEPYSNFEEASYEKGLNDGWECAKKICLTKRNGGIGVDSVKKIFKTADIGEIMKNFSPQEAIEKLKAREEKQEIQVGDVVSIDCKVGEHIVTWKNSETRTLHCMSLKTGGFSLTTESKVKKTGKHIDLTEIFKGLEGEDEDR